MSIQFYALGAGQDVGRSCILLSILDKRILLDCGIHMVNENTFPDFSKINPNVEPNLNNVIDMVLISHFHLDHCGALPYFSEKVGYNGPIIMSDPTKALIPLMLEDYRKINTENKGEEAPFTSEMIKNCMRKAKTIQLHQTLNIKGVNLIAYYAGHVLGAIMFGIEYQGISTIYTGDYNMSADRHLGPASNLKLTN